MRVWFGWGGHTVHTPGPHDDSSCTFSILCRDPSLENKWPNGKMCFLKRTTGEEGGESALRITHMSVFFSNLGAPLQVLGVILVSSEHAKRRPRLFETHP